MSWIRQSGVRGTGRIAPVVHTAARAANLIAGLTAGARANRGDGLTTAVLITTHGQTHALTHALTPVGIRNPCPVTMLEAWSPDG